MDDSFFGFDTTIPDDDGGGGRIAEPPEEEYDALNDETFGSAINGDWEEAHETLVRLGGKGEQARKKGGSTVGADSTDYSCNSAFKHPLSSAPSSSGSTPAPFKNQFRVQRNISESDFELNLSSMKLDDVDVSFFGESENIGGGNASNRINLDSTVWSSQPFGHNQQILRETFPNMFQGHVPLKQVQETNANFGVPPIPSSAQAPKISTLEDIERNLIIQQAIPKQPQQLQQKQQQQPLTEQEIFDVFNLANRQHAVGTPTPQQLQKSQQQQLIQKSQPLQHKAPPGFLPAPQTSPPRANLGFHGAHQLPGLMPTPTQQQLNGMAGNRVPPGFIYPPGLAPNMPQHPLLNQHGNLPPNFPLAGNQRPLPNPHLPTALNNFAMHPSFNAMRAAGMHPAAFMQPVQQARLPPHPLQAANNLLIQQQQPNAMHNMFSMRLVQEIQQNHPLLQNAAAVARQQQHQQQQMRSGSISGDRSRQQHNRRAEGGGGIGANGNLPQDEYDEYANLMSTRDKHWLIGIQLSQLNTDTPYIDDYYYTVYRERKAMKNGQLRHSQAHKDNQLNHPLTQPRGHAQLILVQLGNKNGARNGQHRERRNSENTTNSTTSNNTSSTPLPNYMFSPLKFENSLGKLQYGSVTAPRKIIDADIMGSETSTIDSSSGSASAGLNTDKRPTASTPLLPVVNEVTPTNFRKSRHILLHIETLYRYLLKLEDLENPQVMATIVLKKKKESERIAALEQLEMAHKTPEERAAESANPQTMNPALKNKFNYEIEPRTVLVNKLKAGLTFEKVVSMMNVRKGKILLRRVMPFISDQSLRWTVWAGVFCSLQNVVKKDRDDIEGCLYALYPEFKKHIHESDFETIVNISAAITLNDKKLTGIFCTRFGILSLICLILRSEAIYVACDDKSLSDESREKWREFLAQVATCLNRTIQTQTISAAIESDAIQPLINHCARFKDLKLDGLLALITEAKQQID
ncbi:protein PAT1 homolog 1 [Scaptodrosophila lebanonensis]|uniref:Protein PAT1 homolog 1 n=1 Tax=Drosophila lebanonensis TaxID=7225 RepID=A0A6J2T3I8_DROLE|nr:protein PAT1 homolog 1 [Scaptodrosophila lebanonensis]